ncbi:MAG: Ig-like domain-containing protein [Planctomycetota bacterium]|nr:Ig-like domain-containing protein [Planctomycetota bacterium]
MRALLSACALLVPLAACGGGSGSGASSAAGSFEIVSINVVHGQQWKINRALRVTFSAEVDPATVNFNTVSITDTQGFGATGFFYLAEGDARTVVFQPSCPTLADSSDAGLRPGREYRISVKSAAVDGFSVTSSAGDVLDVGEFRSFLTPDSLDPLVLFVDTVPGPPKVEVLPVRLQPGELVDDGTPSTHVEIGGLRRFFGRDPVTLQGRLEPGLDLPLNHYSLPENQIVFYVHFNQPVRPGLQNAAHLRMQYDGPSGWTAMPAIVQLVANCTETGAIAEVRPLGILPQSTDLRLVLGAGFADLTGDETSADNDTFAMTRALSSGVPNPLFPNVGQPETDEVLETFALGGAGTHSLEDTTALFPVPVAAWGEGILQSSFAFDGTGGPGGDFDWHIPPSTDLVLDTTSDVIFGGPGGAPTGSAPVVNGIVDVRDLYLPASSKILVVGPNTCTILASGSVRVLGQISVQGADNPGVATLNTTNQPEGGAAGQAGGGDGGAASPLTTASSPAGLAGNGPFNATGQGGGGGESSYKVIHPGKRHGAGGGGGGLGHNVRYDHDGLPQTGWVRVQTLVGLDAEHGGFGSTGAWGAINQVGTAIGGYEGPRPFLDNDDGNDFIGTKLTTGGQMILGELEDMLAGSGGGGGGDTSYTDTFPKLPFDPTGDEKGCGGGGGGGGLRILAIGPITVGDAMLNGSIVLDGGTGGGGENSWERYGGGSGGGSGGHLVMSSAASITIHGRATTGGPWYDDVGDSYHSARTLSALGGQGGAGKLDRGGAKATGPVPWSCSAIPFEYFEGHTDVRPYNTACFQNLPHFNEPEGPCWGAGGDGGPGLVQLHVEDLTDIHFPEIEAEFGGTYASGLDVSYAMAPPPEGWKRPGEVPDQMVPFFGRLSMARSRWIPLGLARVNDLGGTDQVVLHGLAGAIPHGPGGGVDHEDPIVGPFVQAQLDHDLVLDASGLAPGDSRYADNPALLRQASLEVVDSADPGFVTLFSIVGASYDPAGPSFLIHLDPGGPNPDHLTLGGDALVAIVPHTARVVTSGVFDGYPSEAEIRLLYDATKVDPFGGGPSTDLAWSTVFGGGDPTDDLSNLNLEDWDFVRFQTIFDLDTAGDGVDLDTARPGLDLLRLQFEF